MTMLFVRPDLTLERVDVDLSTVMTHVCLELAGQPPLNHGVVDVPQLLREVANAMETHEQ